MLTSILVKSDFLLVSNGKNGKFHNVFLVKCRCSKTIAPVYEQERLAKGNGQIGKLFFWMLQQAIAESCGNGFIISNYLSKNLKSKLRTRQILLQNLVFVS